MSDRRGTEQANSAGLLRPDVQPVPARRRHRGGRRRHPTSSTTRRWPMASRRSSTTSSGWRRTAPGSGSSSSGAFADGNHVILHCHQVWPWNLEALSLRRPLRACWCHPAHDERQTRSSGMPRRIPSRRVQRALARRVRPGCSWRRDQHGDTGVGCVPGLVCFALHKPPEELGQLVVAVERQHQ